MSYLSSAQKLRVAMDTAGDALSDAQARTCKLIYQQWSNLIGTTATPGQRSVARVRPRRTGGALCNGGD